MVIQTLQSNLVSSYNRERLKYWFSALLQERQKDYNRLNESLMIKVRKYEQVLLAKGKESQEQISLSTLDFEVRFDTSSTTVQT